MSLRRCGYCVTSLPLVLLSALLVAADPLAGVKWISPSQEVGLTQAEINFVLDVHNRYRAAIATKAGNFSRTDKPQAADMRLLIWSPETAARAQAWANQCGGDMHNTNSASEGQNYAGYSQKKGSFLAAFQGWVDREEPLWRWGEKDGDSYSYMKAAGHYTQVAWSKTMAVGCGFNACPGQMSRFVCNYKYAGNYPAKLPYTAGAPCSECDPGFGFCVDGALCSRSCPRGKSCDCKVDPQRCARHGRFDARTCRCECRAGWTGLNCDEKCRNPDGDSWCLNPSNCKEGSQYFVQYQLRCPKTCGRCQEAGEDNTTALRPAPTGDPIVEEAKRREFKGIDTGTSTTSRPGAIRRNKRKECRDLFDCEYYVRAGSCELRDWATKYCPHSCGICSPGGRKTYPDIGCRDFYTTTDCKWYINSVRRFNMCRRRQWARAICRRSCKLC